MKCIKIIVPKRMEGERLDVAISEMLPEHSRSKITSLIKSGEAMINEKIFKPRDKVSGDEIVSLALNQESNYDWNIFFQTFWDFFFLFRGTRRGTKK